MLLFRTKLSHIKVISTYKKKISGWYRLRKDISTINALEKFSDIVYNKLSGSELVLEFFFRYS